MADSADPAARALVTEADITARMLELARLYTWEGRTAEAAALLARALPRGNYSDPRQWPTRMFDPSLPGKPWHAPPWAARSLSRALYIFHS